MERKHYYAPEAKSPTIVASTLVLRIQTHKMIKRLGTTLNKPEALNMIDEAFRSELGAVASNRCCRSGGPLKMWHNSEDEGWLYPELYKQCLDLASKIPNKEKRGRADTWLKESRDEWEKRRAAEPLGNEREAQRHDVPKASESKEKEPQRGHTEQDAQKIPTLGGYEKEELVFSRAIKKGYMTLDASGHYEWHKSKSLLAYMLGRIYCKDRVMRDNEGNAYLSKKKARFPRQRVKELFGADIAHNRWELKDSGAPPSGYGEIDALFKD